MIRIEPGSGVPLVDQIRSGFKELVFRRQLRPGDALPEAWSLAEMLRISPAAVAEAYDSMTKDGFLTHSHSGFLVSENAWSQSATDLVDSVQDFVRTTRNGRRLGLSWTDLEGILQLLQSHETKDPAGAARQVLKRLGLFGRSQEGSGPAQCPYCREEVAGHDIACCLVCGTAHHPDCWNESGHCSVFGCKGKVLFTFQEPS